MPEVTCASYVPDLRALSSGGYPQGVACLLPRLGTRRKRHLRPLSRVWTRRTSAQPSTQAGVRALGLVARLNAHQPELASGEAEFVAIEPDGRPLGPLTELGETVGGPVIRHVGYDYFLIDLDSTNGVEVNGQMAKRHALADGDVILFGTTEVRVEVS